MHRWPGRRRRHAGRRLRGATPTVRSCCCSTAAGRPATPGRATGETLGAAGYHAVAFDARGHGDSDWAPDGVYGQDAMVDDLEAPDRRARRPTAGARRRIDGWRRSAWSPWGRTTSTPPRSCWSTSRPGSSPTASTKIQSFMSAAAGGLRLARRGGRRHRQLPAPPHSGPDQPRRPGQERPPRRRRPLPLALGPAVPGRPGATDLERRARRGSRRAPATCTLPTLLVRGGLSDILSEEGAQSFLDLCPHSEYVNVTGAGAHGRRRPQRRLRRRRDRVPRPRRARRRRRR